MKGPTKKDFWRRLCKRLRIAREKTCATLALFTLLVIYGVKPAYLIDICSLDIEQTKYLVQELLIASQSSAKVKIVQVGHDIFIVNVVQFSERMSDLLISLTSEYDDQEVPKFAVIDLDFKPESSEIFEAAVNYFPGIRTIMKDDNVEIFDSNYSIGSLSTIELERLISSLVHTFDGSNDHEVFITTNSDVYQNLGGPFIAGLLLGYPSVYKAVPKFAAKLRDEYPVDYEDDVMTPMYENACIKLSYKQLAKVTVFVDIELNESFLCHAVSPSSNSLQASIAILEFTYPLSIHSATGESVETRLEALTNIINNFSQSILNSFHSNMYPLLSESTRSDFFRILRKRLDTSEWTTEGISL